MGSVVEPISLSRLALILIPVAAVVFIQWRWSISPRSTLQGIVRMLAQLLAVGYVLVFLFETDSPILVSLVLFVMISAASGIALRPLESSGYRLYLISFSAIVLGGLPVLYLATQWVIGVDPWYEPRRVLFEDDGAGRCACSFGLVGFVLVLDDSRVLHLWSRVVELETGLVKPTFRLVVLFEKTKASVFELG